jgi:hypothetical protein
MGRVCVQAAKAVRPVIMKLLSESPRHNRDRYVETTVVENHPGYVTVEAAWGRDALVIAYESGVGASVHTAQAFPLSLLGGMADAAASVLEAQGLYEPPGHRPSPVGGKIYIGVDNGPTGSVGVLDGDKAWYDPMPVFMGQDYVKRDKNVTRVDRAALLAYIKERVPEGREAFCLLERPLKNPGQFESSYTAARAYEAVLGVMEELGIGTGTQDSRKWQSAMLPDGTKGSAALKQASFDEGMRLWPHLAGSIIKQNDADGIMLAAYAKMEGM